MSLTLEIEDLMHENAQDFEISKVFKRYIKTYHDNLPTTFASTQGKDFLVKHTKQLDQFITLMYKTVLRQMFGNYLPMRNNIPIALVALGSYGREQLSVYSDIDLMLVYHKVDGFNTEAIIEKLLYRAWDAGLKLGHRVHEVSDLHVVAKEDITIKTALLESRFIAGSTFVFGDVQQELQWIRKTDIKAFIEEKLTESDARRVKYPISMQPYIKEGVGALRDAQVAFWVANALYGITTLRELQDELFSEEEYKEYRIALEFIYRVRTALHISAKKKQDRLILEYIPDVTTMLNMATQTKLVTKTLQSMWVINRFSQIILSKMARPFYHLTLPSSQLKEQRLAKGVFAVDQTLYASFNIKPLTFNQFLKLLNTIEPTITTFDPSLYYVASKVIPPKKFSSQQATLIRSLFYKENLYRIFTYLYHAGLLTDIVKPLKKVLFLAQFDGYHTYAVDIHSLMCLNALENIKDPLAQTLFDNLTADQKAIVRLTTLIHDAGKGRNADHSEVGVKLVTIYGKKIGLSEAFIAQAATLIKYHTLLTATAYRQDIYNEKVIFSVLSKIPTKELLDMLFVLTYADINGVADSTFNSFNAKLLQQLYHNALERIENTTMIGEIQKREQRERAIEKLKKFKTLNKIMQRKVLSIESNMMFLKEKPAQLLDHAIKASTIEHYEYVIKNRGNLSIEIYKRVNVDLGYLLAKLAFLDVVSLDIYKLFDELKYIRIDFMQEAEENSLGFIEELVEKSFEGNLSIKLPAIDIHEDEITIDCEHSKTYARVDIHTKNQKGLLATILRQFDEEGLDVISTKIHSFKKHVRDMFLIEKVAGFCDNAAQIKQRLISCVES
jgi:[protein-PII] uridylyltransferase